MICKVSLVVVDLFSHTWGYDLFPCTVNIQAIVSTHVETVVLLSRKNIEETITIKIDVSSLDTPISHKATYEEIKAYILEQYGINVSTLYISQIKAKYGIIERENYNKGKQKSAVPQCPKEKERAIVEAFKHFGMID